MWLFNSRFTFHLLWGEKNGWSHPFKIRSDFRENIFVKVWLELISDSLDSQIDETNYSSPLFQRIISEIERTTISSEEASEIKDEAAWELAKDRFIREGHKEAVEAIALSMLEREVEVTLIAEVTGLKPEEIYELKTDLSHNPKNKNLNLNSRARRHSNGENEKTWKRGNETPVGIRESVSSFSRSPIFPYVARLWR